MHSLFNFSFTEFAFKRSRSLGFCSCLILLLDSFAMSFFFSRSAISAILIQSQLIPLSS